VSFKLPSEASASKVPSPLVFSGVSGEEESLGRSCAVKRDYRQCVCLGRRGETEEGNQQEPVHAISLIKASGAGKEFLGSGMLL